MGRFKETQPEALEMLNRYAQEGKTIIITGETGTYKTTLLKELLGGVTNKNVIIIARTPEEFVGCNSDNLMIWNEKRYGSSGETSKVAAKYNPDIVGHDDLRIDGMPEAINLWLTGHFGLTTMTGGTAESCLKRISTVAASLHDNLIEKGVQY
ncbi:ATPase, T2SS/T4P/T4SS family, partial [Bacillus mycoides]|uniref:ATPase, T2SS/T4P/T4SS family n=1 Tax=Bacillus mycoides TaxID=1405 RepID=UPI003A80ADEF